MIFGGGVKIRILFVVLLCVYSGAGCSKPEVLSESGKVAQDAFFAIEANPFNGEIVEKAQSDLLRVAKASPDDPWVLIGLSRAFLNAGYQSGDRYDLSSYGAEYVKRAFDLADGAVKHGSRNSMAHAQLARLQIIMGNNRGAWEEVNRAYELDESGFYPWFLRAVICIRMRDTKRAEEPLAEAEQKASQAYQRRWVYDQRNEIGRLTGDLKMRETYLKKVIDLLPNEATPLGNYAGFLKDQQRYDEAVVYYRKAIAINPYPMVVEGLKQAELLKAGARDQKRAFEANGPKN